MRPKVNCLFLLFALTSIAVGCAKQNTWSQAEISNLSSDYSRLKAENMELRRRSSQLDNGNVNQTQLLAQSQQKNQLLSEQLTATRGQLRDTNGQLSRLRSDHNGLKLKHDQLVAATSSRGGAVIKANNSLKKNLPAINIPGVHARADGDVIRVEISSDQLFLNDTAQLRAGATKLIDQVVAEIVHAYPSQTIGIEGHTDNQPLKSKQWSNHHHLSVGRAVAVFDRVVSQGRIQEKQLLIAGHGHYHPIFSNAHPDGRKRNRRVELVVYPDRP